MTIAALKFAFRELSAINPLREARIRALDRLLSLESFVAAVDAGTLTAAAERLGTAKSVVGKRIQDLEAHLGARLLNRNARALSLTDAGSGFYLQAKRLLAELTEAEASVTGLAGAPRGTLRLSAPMSFGTLHLKSVAVALMRDWPDLIVDLDLSDRQVDLATEGHDLAVRIGRLPDSSLIARKIATNRHRICASPAYLDERGIPTVPEDLAGHDGLMYSTREPHGMWQIEVDGELRSYRVRTRMRCNNGEVLQEAALAGLGLAILPTFMAAPHIDSGALRTVLTGHALPDGDISAVYVPDRHLSAKVRVMIDALIAAYGLVPPWDRQA